MWVSQLVCQDVWRSGKRSLQLPFRDPAPLQIGLRLSCLWLLLGPVLIPIHFFLWWVGFKVDLGVSP